MVRKFHLADHMIISHDQIHDMLSAAVLIIITAVDQILTWRFFLLVGLFFGTLTSSCSLGCYKLHKDTCLPVEQTAPSVPEVKEAVSAEPWSVEDLLHEEDIIDKVPVQRLQLLGQSKELRDLLCNRHLRQLLRSIDCAASKDDAMKAAMQEPLFVEFSDQCLKIVENEAKSLTSNEADDL
ncbi:zinc finger HIT domain-containing protein 3 isoform X1 [Seriola aureovittata]|uniref:zinc finger HIT domain-containing protein 3 isoform X1 n=1 Tax=Seriola aureovittata TaxID=2871759 RepID=UPI0024BEB71C|nr:zinc finger HIT domain-containing protein 3 isoform X1 [Seriola aureovittata]